MEYIIIRATEIKRATCRERKKKMDTRKRDEPEFKDQRKGTFTLSRAIKK
jgi:hypothetical protein